MPEGDTIFRTATVLRKALAGKTVTRFETSLEPVAEKNTRRPVVGRIVHAVEPRGKHLLIVFRTPGVKPGEDHPPIKTPPALNLELLQDDAVLHTHLRMTGSWHVYRPNETWRKAERLARATIYNEEFVVPCFSAPIVELLSARETARHPGLATLGPDAITPEFDAAAAFERIRLRPDLEISVALMDQRAMAGVGNVFKSEVLFIRRVSPFLRVRELDDRTLEGLIEESHRLLRLNTTRGDRRTMSSLNNNQLLWVYGRTGQSCRVCGDTIRMRRQGLEGRTTYYCCRCQSVKPMIHD